MNPDIASRIPPSMRADLQERMDRLRAEETAVRAIIEQVRQLPAEKQEDIAERILEGLPEEAE